MPRVVLMWSSSSRPFQSGTGPCTEWAMSRPFWASSSHFCLCFGSVFSPTHHSPSTNSAHVPMGNGVRNRCGVLLTWAMAAKFSSSEMSLYKSFVSLLGFRITTSSLGSRTPSVTSKLRLVLAEAAWTCTSTGPTAAARTPTSTSTCKTPSPDVGTLGRGAPIANLQTCRCAKRALCVTLCCSKEPPAAAPRRGLTPVTWLKSTSKVDPKSAPIPLIPCPTPL
mmetsp:Transcript_31914/g.74691  ORF Transcript_31914/g.74691 Transcript_31914/m.74691 type:complete len:223 (-) Transcript_31914:1559-2227(-)